MFIVDASVRQELLELQKRAKEKRSWEQLFLQEREIIFTVNDWLPQTSSLLLPEALKQDLRLMPLFEAIASWCDPEGGLGNQFPLEILKIARKLLPEEQDNGSTPNDKSS